MRWCALLLVLVVPGSIRAAESALVRISVEPTAIELTGVRDRQGVVVQAVYADQSTRDVTALATFSFEKPIASATNGFLAPLADGLAMLTVSHEGREAKVPVTVKKIGEVEALHFRTDVMPVLTKVGCNTGKCHGSAAG